MAEAELVRIDLDRLAALVDTYAVASTPPPMKVTRRPLTSIDADRALLVVALDAINFGSGYHDVIRKDVGLSGARSMAARLQSHVEASGPLTTERLIGITPGDCSQIFGQELDGGALEELMTAFAIALHDLGAWLEAGFGGSIIAAIEACDRSAVALAESLLTMPYYRDVERVELAGGPTEVSFYKRAQITPADLERSCGPGLFDDLARLTAFADNLVPHVLRVDRALVVDPVLSRAIDAGRRLDAGARCEIELRAGGVVAVEWLAARTGLRPMDLDLMLWERGGQPRYKAVPRHRARSVFY